MWLTPNEWQIAQRFGQAYWLYIVVNATTEPQLKRIQDPVHSLKVVEEKESVRYFVAHGLDATDARIVTLRLLPPGVAAGEAPEPGSVDLQGVPRFPFGGQGCQIVVD